MSRVAIFAHFDKNNKIKKYVIYYIKELQKIAEKIIFVSDCNLSEEELDKIKQYVFYSIAYKHNEYDFGSYKRGFLFAKKSGLLEGCDELIFANDSCYGPIYPFEKVWNNYCTKADFWGININQKKHPLHVQSFFLVFKPKVFYSECFNNFMLSIKQEKNKEDIIQKYEIGLSQKLIKQGFSVGALFQETIVMHYSTKLLYFRKANPLIKISVFRNLSKMFVYLTCCFLFSKYKIKYPKSCIIENIDCKYPNFQDLIKSLKFLNINIHKQCIRNDKLENVIPFMIDAN